MNWKNLKIQPIVTLLTDFRFFFAVVFISIIFLEFVSQDSPQDHPHSVINLLVVDNDAKNVYLKNGNNSDRSWSKLFRNDLITYPSRIHSLSNGNINFDFLNQNGFINLSENSDVIVNRTAKEIKFDLLSGEIYMSYHTQADKTPLSLTFNNNRIEITNADVFLRVPSTGVSTLSINYGQVDLYRDSKNVILKSSEIIQFEDTQYTIFDHPVKMTTPLNQDHYFLINHDKIKIRFAIRSNEPLSDLRLFIGPNPQSLKSVVQTKSKSLKNEFVIDCVEGTYYAQFIARIGKNSYFTDLNKFYVERQESVKPISPSKDQIISKDLVGSTVRFQWENPSQFEKLFLEISRSSQFNDLLFHETIEANNYFMINFEKPGSYYWRVNGFPKKSTKLILGESSRLFIK